MKHFKFISFFLLFLLFQSCIFADDLNVEDNSRLQFVGRVMSDANNPVVGVSVIAKADLYVVGSTTTDANGFFDLISLDATGRTFNNTYGLEVVVNEFSLDNESLTEHTSVFIDSRDRFYDFETIELKTSAQLELNIQNTENTSDTFSWSLHYTNTQCNQVFVEGQMQEDESDCYSQTSVFRTLNENTPNFSRSYSVVLNTEAQFTYSVNGSDPITELIQINNPNTVYNVEY
jgi:hypothetical protein